MVNITIYIEGSTIPNKNEHAEIVSENIALFREGFSKLFEKIVDINKFNLIIKNLGSVTQAPKYLQKITLQNLNHLLLIDLDLPESQRVHQIDNNYKNCDISKLFFMVQEMEAWILSQPESIYQFAIMQKYILKDGANPISENTLIKNIIPSKISNPSDKLKTIFKQTFQIKKYKNKKLVYKNKDYSKTKDAPLLIQNLDANTLKSTFKDFKLLVEYINNNTYL